MPRVSMKPENKAESAFDYPRLKLSKGERARINCIETEPYFEYVHTLRAPQIQNGKAVMETVKAKDGSEIQQVKYDFVGRHICIGDYGTIDEKGLDAANCPVCAKSTMTDAVRPPERRFASHVLKYATRPGTFDIAEPFTVGLVAWTYGDQIFNKLVDTASEWGDLRTHDLNLGPCTQEQFQKFEIAVAANAAWLTGDDRKKLALETFKANQAKEPSALLGRRLDRGMIEADLDKVLTRYDIAFKTGASSDATPQPPIDLDDLLSASTDTAVPKDSNGKAFDETPLDPGISDTLAAKADLDPFDEGLAAVGVPQTTEAPATLDFDDLLGDV